MNCTDSFCFASPWFAVRIVTNLKLKLTIITWSFESVGEGSRLHFNKQDMTKTGGLSRKKKVRAIHRVSVTRMIDQVQEMLTSGEWLECSQAKTEEASLSSKDRASEQVGRGDCGGGS